ncbi:MAG: helix-turn-helix domain-containing protein [Myxococcales bacterium]|nr:helix-turn-helix domain-containing protein [Myxococcales bacterium]
MDIKPIHTKADHKAALTEIERLWDAAPGTPEFDKLDVLGTLVDAYERAHTPLLPPDPVEAIKFRLEQQGRTRKDLEPILGTRARVSEILNGQRSLTLAMIRALHRELELPLDALVAEGPRRPPTRGRSQGRTPRPRRAPPRRRSNATSVRAARQR